MYVYRGSQSSNTPTNDTGHSMWTLDATDAYYGYASEDMGRMWRLDVSNAPHINNLYTAICAALAEDIENGDLNADMDNIVASLVEQGLNPVDTLAAEFNPANIVDSAAAYDNADMVAWLWDRILDPSGIYIILTDNGAICFDQDLAENMGEYKLEAI